MCQDEKTQAGYSQWNEKEDVWLQQQRASNQKQSANAAVNTSRPPLLYELRNERANLSQRLLNTERLIKWLESNPEIPLMVDLLRDRAKGGIS
jgi:hypothetical protein